VGNVVIHQDVVEKQGASVDLRIEAEKMRRARRIGLDSGLFSVPEVYDFDSESGMLRMERIQGLTGIRNLGMNRDLLFEMAARAGMALAAVHRDLRLPDEMTTPIPKEFEGEGADVYLHGDYSGENVCVVRPGRAGAPQLVLIDWQLSPRVGGQGNRGSRHFDLAWFVGNLFRKPLHRYAIDPSASRAASLFLSAYARLAPAGALEGFGGYLMRLRNYRLVRHEANLHLAKRLLLTPGFWNWRRFAEEFDPGNIAHA
jgi:hypothetical protein